MPLQVTRDYNTIVNSNCIAILAIAFNCLAKGSLTKRKRCTKVKVFVASLANINKTLVNKVKQTYV
jgi:hypothetical protein